MIYVGYSQIKGKSYGDLDKRIYQKVDSVSPVPGGVGPLTVVYLLKNVIIAAQKNN